MPTPTQGLVAYTWPFSSHNCHMRGLYWLFTFPTLLLASAGTHYGIYGLITLKLCFSTLIFTIQWVIPVHHSVGLALHLQLNLSRRVAQQRPYSIVMNNSMPYQTLLLIFASSIIGAVAVKQVRYLISSKMSSCITASQDPHHFFKPTCPLEKVECNTML